MLQIKGYVALKEEDSLMCDSGEADEGKPRAVVAVEMRLGQPRMPRFIIWDASVLHSVSCVGVP